LHYRSAGYKNTIVMAVSKTNVLTQGLSGALGKQIVFKHYKDKTVIAAYPTFTKPWSKAQQEHRLNMSEAFRAAATIMNAPGFDPAVYSRKLKPGQNIRNLIVREQYQKIVERKNKE